MKSLMAERRRISGKKTKRVTGLGGLFFKARDPEKLYAWYEKNLGIRREPDNGVAFRWREYADARETGFTVWSIFPRNTRYFRPSRKDFMMNFRVDDLDALLAALKRAKVKVDPHREDYDYGRFAWIVDPEGNRIELWEPPKPGKKRS
jgi:predicted enzyme related to lactoylglutathione lyase